MFKKIITFLVLLNFNYAFAIEDMGCCCQNDFMIIFNDPNIKNLEQALYFCKKYENNCCDKSEYELFKYYFYTKFGSYDDSEKVLIESIKNISDLVLVFRTSMLTKYLEKANAKEHIHIGI